MYRILLLAGWCILLACASCGNHKEHKEERIQFVATRPLIKDTIVTKSYVAQIRSVQHIELRAQEKGYLQKIYVDEGQFVKKGQLLFQIMPQLYEAEVKKAQTEVEFAEIEYQNTHKLKESNIVSANELAMAQAKLNKARAELNIAQVHLQFTTIRAPFDGIIDRFLVRVGSLLDEGELLTSLSDNNRVWVYFNVPEVEYLNLFSNGGRQKHPVALEMANHALFPHAGQIETIEADFDNETGNISIRAGFPNPDKLLRNGETGNILIRETMQGAVLIPQKASFEVMDKLYVYVIDKEHRIRTREIKIAAELEDIFIVSEGLSDQDIILLEGIRKVKDGDQVEFKTEDPGHVIAGLKLPAQ